MKKRVLIVEDDLSLEPFWKSVIQRVSSQVDIHWADSVDSASHKRAQLAQMGEQFDLIIVDMFLLGSLTGADFVKDLSREEKSQAIMTSSVKYSKLNQYFETIKESPPFLHKPYSFYDCVEIVRWILSAENFSPNLADATR